MNKSRFLALVALLATIVYAPLTLAEEGIHLDVHKSQSCGCCTLWMDHLTDSGIQSTPHHPADLAGLKRKLGIGVRHSSCHTGVSADGFVFEGHVPAKFVKQFLANPPADAIGLSVPAMPVGSPGMEYEDKFMPYRVLVLKADGTVGDYAVVDSYAAQFE